MAHTCNPTRDQEDHDLKPARANSSRDPISKQTHERKRAGGVAQGVGPEFKPQYCQKKKKIMYQREDEGNHVKEMENLPSIQNSVIREYQTGEGLVATED
jgi:hypothetical protein